MPKNKKFIGGDSSLDDNIKDKINDIYLSISDSFGDLFGNLSEMISEEYDKLFNMVSEEYEKISSEIFESLDNTIGPIIEITNKGIAGFWSQVYLLWTVLNCRISSSFRTTYDYNSINNIWSM